MELITLAGGCFWCTEAIFQRLKGVNVVTPGYAGGTMVNPTYEQVCSGQTGHAEAIQVEFDPKIITLEKILDIFWYLHDPTTLNRQGNDVGTQYRSAIFYRNDHQKEVAEKSMKALVDSDFYKNPIVTQIVPFTSFYKAEDYHQNFYNNNRSMSYCRLIIDPKIEKLLKQYSPDTKVGL